MQHLRFKAGAESALWVDRLAHYRLAHYHQDCHPVFSSAGSADRSAIVITESNPVDFLAASIAAIETRATVILGNPQWQVSEWQALADLFPLKLKTQNLKLKTQKASPRQDQGAILIATGGSAGVLRFAQHTWETLIAAVQGLQRSTLLPPQPLCSCCVLPLYHVSGFMQFVRSYWTEGDLVLSSSRELLAAFKTGTIDSQAEFWSIPWEQYYLSLVPTQLHRFLTELPPAGLDWLRRFSLIFVGGAALREDLRQQARALQLPLAPTYGMTETAGMVATLPPQAFLAGNNSVGRLLPHAQVQFLDLEKPGQTWDSEVQQGGRMVVRADSLALGYYPPDRSLANGILNTNDRGWMGTDNYLYIAGRLDRVITTGGEKVNPESVEAMLLQTGLLREVAVLGIPDSDWGEQVVACCVGVQDWQQLKTIATQRLSPPQRPKVWIELDALPRNDRGKLLMAEIAKILKDQGI